MVLSKFIGLLAPFTSRDNTRLALAGVYCNPANQTMQATNGHVLAILSDLESPLEGKPVLIPYEPIEQASKQAKGIPIEFDGHALKAGTIQVAAEPYALDFPDTTQVIPKPEATPHHIGVQASYLELIGATARKLFKGTDKIGVRIEIPKDKVSPMRFVASNGVQEIVFIVMPVRL